MRVYPSIGLAIGEAMRHNAARAQELVDDEEFCPDCFAGMESSEHFEKCELPARRREERQL